MAVPNAVAWKIERPPHFKRGLRMTAMQRASICAARKWHRIASILGSVSR
jgi:hypothetical protein